MTVALETTGPQRAIMLGEARKLKAEGKALGEMWDRVNRSIRALGGEGRLGPGDLVDFQLAEAVVLEVMADGRPRTEDEIMAEVRGRGVQMRSSAVMRRVRHLRGVLARIGWTVKATRQDLPGRVWTYGLQKLQGDLPF